MKKNRGVEMLDKTFRKKVELFLKEANKDKKNIFITESFRSLERQKFLFGQGRSKSELIKSGFSKKESLLYSRIVDYNGKKLKKITRTLNSKHNSGQAIDIAFYGKELYPKDFIKWRKIANIAKKYHIDWGYDLWKNDKPHFQDSSCTLFNRTRKAVSLGLIKVDENNKNELVDKNTLGAIIYKLYNKIKEQK